VSPRARRVTRPLGCTLSQVMEPCCRDNRNQASGGNCRALKHKITYFKYREKSTKILTCTANFIIF
jgi:hypothetical protein